MRVKLVASFALGILCVSGVVGCSKTANDNDHPKDELRIDVMSEIPTLDPTMGEDVVSTRVGYDLFATLVSFDQENNPIPGLAEKWEISPDGKTYTFHLRKNLKFSDGSPLTATDVVYSLDRLEDPKTASPYSWLLSNVQNANLVTSGKASPDKLAVSAPDADTVVIKLNDPDMAFLQALSLPDVAVVDRKVIDKYGQAWIDPSHIVTSGAYVLKEHVVNGYMLAVKNPYYYDAANVSIPKVKYLPLQDKNATIPTYEAGGVDITFENVPVDQYQDLEKKYPKQLHTVSQEALYYYDFNMKDPKFANVKLRQALTMAVDREVLTRDVLKQKQVPLYSYATPTIEHGAYAKVVYPWSSWPRAKQIAEAKKLYKEAGYSQANPLSITISYNTDDLHKKVALALAAMWKSTLGVNVQQQNQDWKTFIQTRHNGNFEMARDGWVADFDSVTAYTPIYACSSDENNSHYCNPAYDNLVNQAGKSLDPATRTKLYQQALNIAMNDYPDIPLFQYTYTRLVKPYVKGYNPDNNHLDHVQSQWMKF
jgi:oligopeptide transport system substrate-binding protein